MNIDYIKTNYVNLYEAAEKLYTFENKVHQLIDDVYGKNTFEGIMKLHEFNQEIENVQNNIIIENDQFNRLAQKYMKYFTIYNNIAYELKQTIGLIDTFKIMDILQQYFKTKL